MAQPLVYGDTYGGVAQNEMGRQAADDAFLFNMLASRQRDNDAAFRNRSFTSDDTYRRWLATQNQDYQNRALAQSGSQFDRGLDLQRLTQGTDADYRNRALAQSGSQFDRNLSADAAYKWAALNQSGNQFNANLNQQARNAGNNNAVAWATLDANRAAQAANTDYSNRALAQSGNQFDRNLGLQQDVNSTQWQHLMDQEAERNGQRDEAKRDNLYKELTGNIANGVIRDEKSLGDWENGQLSGDQYSNLTSLLGEAGRRTNQAYDLSRQKAEALNAQLGMQLAPLRPAYDAAQKDLANAVPNKSIFSPSTWGHPSIQDAQNALPLMRYNQEQEKFLQNVGKSKGYGDVIYEPVSGKFVPASPAPEGYTNSLPNLPAQSLATTTNSLPISSVGTQAPAISQQDYVNVPGTDIWLPGQYYNEIKKQAGYGASVASGSDVSGYYQKVLSQLLAAGVAQHRAAQSPDLSGRLVFDQSNY